MKILLALVFAVLCSPVLAQDYPARPVRLIVTFTPGGGADTTARVFAERLSDLWKQQVVVENRPGGGGTIGTRQVVRAAPDGYTLLLGHTGTIAINPSLYANIPFDPRKELEAIGMIASMPVALLAHPSFKPQTVKEFIDLAKKEPGKLNLGTSAVGTGGYMCAELFKSEAGVDVAIIPYKGTAPVMNDLLGGHVPVAFGVLPPALGNIASGNLRVIAVASKERFSGLPNVPTFAEAGLPGFDGSLHYGLLAPKGTPKDIIDRLSAELRKAVNTDEVKQRIATEGGDPMTSTAAEYADDVDKEEKKWGGLVRKLNLKVD